MYIVLADWESFLLIVCNVVSMSVCYDQSQQYCNSIDIIYIGTDFLVLVLQSCTGPWNLIGFWNNDFSHLLAESG